MPQLTRHLEAYRHQHDFVHVMEPTTKAEQALAAMGRHPGHVIVMVDAVCRARGTLEELAHIRADVAMFMRPKPFRSRIRHAVRSNTIVLRPSRGAHRFVKIWIEATKEVHDLIQSPLAVAVERATDVTFQPLHPRFCVIPADGDVFGNLTFSGAWEGLRRPNWWERLFGWR